MNKLFFADFIILSTLAFINFKFIPLQYKILSIIVWVIIIVLSLLINFNLVLYFVSLLIIGLCGIVMYTIKTVTIDPANKISFWIMYVISTIILVAIIISKKLIYDIIVSDGQTGDKGIVGKQGTYGESYFLTNRSEIAYNKIILNIESVLKKHKSLNNNNDYLLQNLYFKELIKNICYSEQYVYITKLEEEEQNQNGKDQCQTIKDGDPKRVCLNGKNECSTDKDCTGPAGETKSLSTPDSCFELQFQIPTTTKSSNTSDSDNSDPTNQVFTSCQNMTPTKSGEEIIEERITPVYDITMTNVESKINNVIMDWVTLILDHSSGFIFLNTFEYIDTFFDQNNPLPIVKCGKEKQVVTYSGDNPFKSIKDAKKHHIKIENNSDGLNYGNPYYWGINKI